MKTKMMDEFGFVDGIHVLTGQDFDERFFKREVDKDGNYTGRWINVLSGKERDLLGYDHDGIDENGFERFGFEKGNAKLRVSKYHPMGPDGKRTKRSRARDDEKRNFRGFATNRKYVGFGHLADFRGTYRINLLGFQSDGKYYDRDGSISLRDPRGYDIDGVDDKGFKESGIHLETSSRYNMKGIDRDGKLNPQLRRLELAFSFMKQNGNASPSQLVKYLNEKMKEEYPEDIQKIDVDGLDNMFNDGMTAFFITFDYRNSQITEGLRAITVGNKKGTIIPLDGKTAGQFRFRQAHGDLYREYAQKRYGNTKKVKNAPSGQSPNDGIR